MPQNHTNFIEQLRKNKGLMQFIIRSVAFGAILLGFYFFIFFYFRYTQFFLNNLRVGDEFYLPFLSGLRKTDFLDAGLFTVILFAIWNRDTLLNLKVYIQDKKQTIIFGILAILSQVIHYSLKYWINNNLQQAISNQVVITLLKYSLNIASVVFLALAVYNLQIFRDQFSKFKKQLPFLAGFMAAYFFMIQFFQFIWVFLSDFVAGTVYHMLKLTFGSAYLAPSTLTQGPKLGVNNFIVGISKECSGIDSLLLFLSLYFILFVLDWNRMDRKKMLILLVPGIIITIAYNLVRVYLIMIVGILINPTFAIDVFHTNIGWMLFLIVFIVFWQFGSSWVYLKDVKRKHISKK